MQILKKYDANPPPPHIFVESRFYEAIGSLPVMPSLLPYIL